MSSGPAPRERYRELVARVDAFFAHVLERHRAEMRCGPGCDGCCRVQPTLTPIEADAVAAWLAGLDADARHQLRQRARADRPNRCVALAEDGRCLVYAVRPLICRSHGIPIRMRDAQDEPFVAACVENFTDGLPEPDAILDQETLSTILLALNRAHASDDSGEEPRRTPLGALLLRTDSGD